MKIQYNSLTMLLSSFMQDFGPISSRVYCIFAQITYHKFVVELSIRNLNKYAQFKHCYWLCGKKYNSQYTRDDIGPNSCINRNQHS
jgi:hypothetical protein